MSQMGSPLHLAKRFVTSVLIFRVDERIEFELLALLSDEEKVLYLSQPRIDRIHSVRNAKFIIGASPGSYKPEHVVAAALHDVGKAEAELGVVGRVFATILQSLLSEKRIKTWGAKEGLKKQIYWYCLHNERGAELLEEAGSASVAVAWARYHHDREDHENIPAGVIALLRKADRI